MPSRSLSLNRFEDKPIVQLMNKTTSIPTVYELLESLNRTAELPVFNLQVNVLPSLFELVGLLLVPIQIKVSLVVSLEHPFADHSGLLKLILQVVKYFTFLIDFGPPLLQINIFYTMYIYHAQYINAFNNTKHVM